MSFLSRRQLLYILVFALLAVSAALMGYGPIILNSLRPSSIEPIDDQLSKSVLSLNDANFGSAINDNPFFVLDFYRYDCSSCKIMDRIVSELSDELEGQIVFGRMSIEANKKTAAKYLVQSHPTLLLFNDGILMKRIEGNRSKSDLLEDLKELKKDLNTSNVQFQTAAARGLPMVVVPMTRLGVGKPAKPMPITDEDIGSALEQYPFIVVDASTTWCEWCLAMNATVEDLAKELQGQVAFGMNDMDQNKDTKDKYNITSYPTSLIFRDGKLVDKVIGYQQKSSFVSKLKQIDPELDTSSVKVERQATAAQVQEPVRPQLAPEQVCANMTKSDKPLLEAFVVSKCPFGLQMQRIMAGMISQSAETKNYLLVRYIGSVSNGSITSMHGDEEAQENLRQICIREEQSDRYWGYVGCYMKEGKSESCLKSSSIDQSKLRSCMSDSSRGLSYSQKDFDRAAKFQITGSPTLVMGDQIVSEFDFQTDTTSGRSPEALKELLCCGFKTEPGFCSQEFAGAQAKTMFEVNQPSAASAQAQKPAGRDITLTDLGSKNPSQAMLITDKTLASAQSQYPLLVVEGFANWCGYCKMFNVTVDELAKELQGQVAFSLIDMDRNNKTKTDYNITAYPTSLVFKDGKLVDTVVGNVQKSVLVAKLKQANPELNTSQVKIVQAAPPAPPRPKLTPEQACVNITKSDKPLLEAFVVSKCPFGLQMQRIMANIIGQFEEAEAYLKVRYIGSVEDGAITSMHGDEEAQENLRQICIRDEQSDRYWDYVGCYMKEGKSDECLRSSAVDESKLGGCMSGSDRGLAYAQEDFDRAEKFGITGSPTLIMGDEIVRESDFATSITNGRSPEALKELLCCGFKSEPSFCSQELNKSRMATMFSMS